LTPPTLSALFSLLASQLASTLDAPRSDRTYTDEPCALGSTKASAWIETNRSALTARALVTRVTNGTK
jgi:hypothetical protein